MLIFLPNFPGQGWDCSPRKLWTRMGMQPPQIMNYKSGATVEAPYDSITFYNFFQMHHEIFS